MLSTAFKVSTTVRPLVWGHARLVSALRCCPLVQQLADYIFYIFTFLLILAPLFLAYRLDNRDICHLLIALISFSLCQFSHFCLQDSVARQSFLRTVPFNPASLTLLGLLVVAPLAPSHPFPCFFLSFWLCCSGHLNSALTLSQQHPCVCTSLWRQCIELLVKAQWP